MEGQKSAQLQCIFDLFVPPLPCVLFFQVGSHRLQTFCTHELMRQSCHYLVRCFASNLREARCHGVGHFFKSKNMQYLLACGLCSNGLAILQNLHCAMRQCCMVAPSHFQADKSSLISTMPIEVRGRVHTLKCDPQNVRALLSCGYETKKEVLVSEAWNKFILV